MSFIYTRNGFRGEYLAKYIVSRFAFVSESQVEDWGIDFYCGLIKNNIDEQKIYYDKPFLLQIKTKTKEEYVQRYQKPIVEYAIPEFIDTVYGLEVPFFIGFLDLVNQSLEIHSTSSMWFPYMLAGARKIEKLKFKFRSPGDTSNVVSLPRKVGEEVDGRYTWEIDLGNPVIKVNFEEIENDIPKIENLKSILSRIIDKDFENIVSKKLGLSYFRWMYEYETNILDSFKCGYKFVNKGDGDQFTSTAQQMLEAMHQYLVSLAITLKYEGNFVLYDKIRENLRLIPEENRFKDVEVPFPEMYEDIEYDKVNIQHLPTTGFTYTVAPAVPDNPYFSEDRQQEHKVKLSDGKPSKKQGGYFNYKTKR